MTNDVVTRNGFQQLNSIVGSEIIHFFFYAADNFKVVFKQLNLNVNVQV
jgi:hypothetical protein